MLNILFPKECLVCSKVGEWLCKKCKKKLFKTLPTCYICKTLSNEYHTHNNCLRDRSFSKITTLWKYNEYSKKLIHNYKYKHRFKVGDYIFSLFEDKIENFDFKNTILIPLPTHQIKRWERGFNPTENITKLISEKMRVPINTKIIFKKQSNVSQASLSYDEREKNVEGIFEINEKEKMNLLKYEHIIIVDDIMTTGATLNEAIFVLRRCIPKSINISALCIFQGRNESKKFLQSDKKKEKKI